ncbi:MAG: hypothetical protein LUI87_03715 [Lachnospiraceae bacterium]|nr:hypothetical protein [Lachnospiraceae bacterium]
MIDNLFSLCYTEYVDAGVKKGGNKGMEISQAAKYHEVMLPANEVINALQRKLDDAIDDMEQGRVQTIEDAWEEIDSI